MIHIHILTSYFGKCQAVNVMLLLSVWLCNVGFRFAQFSSDSDLPQAVW